MLYIYTRSLFTVLGFSLIVSFIRSVEPGNRSSCPWFIAGVCTRCMKCLKYLSLKVWITECSGKPVYEPFSWEVLKMHLSGREGHSLLTLSDLGYISWMRKSFTVAIISLFQPAWTKKKERESNIYCNLNSNDGLFWRYVLSKELLLLKDGRNQRQGGITCITTRPKVIHYVIMILVCHLCLELVRTLLIPNHVPCSYRKSSSSLWPASCVCASFLLRSCRLSSSTWGRNTPMPAPAALFCSWLK